MRTATTIAILIATSLAGCADAPTEAPIGDGPVITDATGKKVRDEAPSDETVTTESGKKVAANKALLRGRVHDDFNFSLSGAYVSIVGTSHFTQTDKTGNYVIENVTVGTFDVRFEMDQFKAKEMRVVLGAGKEVRLDAELLPLQVRTGGFNPHVHDPWDGATSYELMDDTINIHDEVFPSNIKNPAPGVARAASCGLTDGCSFPFEIPEQEGARPATIWPGTKELRVTLTWGGAAMAIDGTRLEYADATMISFDRKESPTVANGETIIIPVAREMQDHGHAKWTAWRFAAVPVNSQSDPGYVYGTLRIQMEIVRGETFLDPPHEDFWQGRSELSWEFRHFPNVGVPPTDASSSGLNFVFTIPGCPPKDAPADCVDIIPPGTERLEIHFAWLKNTQGMQAPFDYSLTYKSADRPPSTHVDEYAEPTLLDEDLEADWRLYEIVLGDGEADGFYMQHSDWLFKWHQDTGLPYHVLQNQFQFDVKITAFKMP